MKRKDYQKPSMKVVELRQRCQILAGSPNGVRGSRSSYGEANTDVDPSEIEDGTWAWK